LDFLDLLGTIHGNLVLEIGLIIILATILSFIVRLFKQPLIPAYIIAGVILGPIGLGLIKDPVAIRALSELGISFLLFVVGLEINLSKLKTVGPAVIFGGLLQIIAVYVIGYFTALSLGFAQFESTIIGLVLTFSSTMVVIKLLSDSEQIDTLHGRLALGILLIQDVVVFIVLALLATFNESFSINLITNALLKLIVLSVIAFLFGKYIFPGLFSFAAKSKELLFMASITVLFLFTTISHLLEFSIAIGAFLAGMALANLPYHHDIIGKVNPLKTFFATLFFVSLGMQLTPIPYSSFKIAFIFLGIILIIKPIVIYLLTTFFGYEKRTAFLTGLSLGQVSEFSLIIVTLPFVLNLISAELFSMIIFIAIITMILTSYVLEFQNGIYMIFLPILNLIEKIIPINLKHELEYKAKQSKNDTVLIGCHRMGAIFLDTLKNFRKKVLVIDNNPEIIKRLIKRKIPSLYGDVRNREILDKIRFKKIKTIVSTVPHEIENLFLIDYVKSKNPKINLLVTANHFHSAKKMYNAGADYVILPHLLTGEKVSLIMRKTFKNKKYLKNLTKKHYKLLGVDENLINKF
jgi:Kef-type K+ transport system membrane component KefB